MCTPIPAQVISLQANGVLIDSNGRQIAVSCSRLPDIQPGDWVLVYLGQIVSRVSSEEAGALQELLQMLSSPANDGKGGRYHE
jgi:hydrogenase assembly chaperone HypC/HupF